MAEKSTNYYESDRIAGTLTQSDFAKEESFSNLDHDENLVDYLIEKDEWDKLFITQKSGRVVCDASSANMIYRKVYNEFIDNMDSVQIFHQVTEFYNLEGKFFFDMLLKKHRDLLISDLEKRIGTIKIDSEKKFSANRVQKAFNIIFQ